ncbi:MAG: ABC transporter substrate-binding protein [Oceanospirillaceae bacterium]
MMKRCVPKSIFKVLLLLFGYSTLLTFSNIAIAAHKTIKIPLLDWSSQRVISIAMGKTFSQYQYEVEYQTMSEDLVWGALARGRVHFQLEIWQASASNEFTDMLHKKRITDLGLHSALTIEDWWYPQYVEEQCPGLPDWKALRGCAELFSEDGKSEGIYFTGPWPYRDADLIRALKLNFRIQRHADNNDIWIKLEKAQAANKPIILLNWAPNWTDQRVKGKFVEFPKYTPECETDPSWGVSPNIAFDCGNVRNGWIKKAAWSKFEESFPCAYQFIRNIDLNNQMIAEAAALVDYDGYAEEEAALLWLQKYQQVVLSWVKNSCLPKHKKRI